VFSSAIETMAKKRIDEIGKNNVKTGIFHLFSKNPLFGYGLPNNCSLIADKNGSLYSGKIVIKNAKYYMLTFHNYDKNGNFLGFISDPIPIQIP